MRSAKPAADRVTLRTSWARISSSFFSIQQVPPANEHRPGNCMKIPCLSMFSMETSLPTPNLWPGHARSMLVGGMVKIMAISTCFMVLLANFDTSVHSYFKGTTGKPFFPALVLRRPFWPHSTPSNEECTNIDILCVHCIPFSRNKHRVPLHRI